MNPDEENETELLEHSIILKLHYRKVKLSIVS